MRRHHEHVAGLDDGNGRVDHQVVARGHEHRDRAAGDTGGGVDRTHVRAKQPAPPLRFVNGGYAGSSEPANIDLGIGAVYRSNNRRCHVSSPVTCGNTRWYASAYAIPLRPELRTACVPRRRLRSE